ncbi:MAG: hypothetical protein OXN83_01875, partial [Oligoflexia bacterium]|nr:hypothetical protein [Oligoflexia bacterium]
LFVYLKKDLKIEKGGAELFIDDYSLGQIIINKVHEKNLLKFLPTEGYHNTFLMMGPQDSVREANFPKKFPVYIRYKTKDGNSFKSAIPDWTCKKEKQEINLELPHFEPLTLNSNT